MIPTLVITLREGVEASLIVGIVAAFLVKEGKRESLKAMWIGVGAAVVVCSAVAVGLRIVDNELPQRQQEGLETVIGLVAVAMISYMVIWMRRNSRGLKKNLEGGVASALARGSAAGLVGMAFLAVLREGFETAVFLLAAFQDSDNTATAGAGAVIGLIAAIAIGYAIYKGGVKINLSKFFRATGLILVLVAAGLLATAVHTAHEATWFNSLQGQALDLSWLVKPGTVSGSLLTGMLGLQPRPTDGELLAYLIYAIPMALYVGWPQGSSLLSWISKHRPGAGATTATMSLIVVAALLAGCGGNDVPKGAKTLNYTISDSGCDPATQSIPAGPYTFDVKNDGGSSVTEMELLDKDGKILGEKENLSDGLSGSFSLNLDPGVYVISCPDADTDKSTLTVTAAKGGAATASSATSTAAVATYRKYVEQNTADLVSKSKVFTDAVKSGDVAGAKAAYAAARIPYERIEPVAESFGDLDPEIDARQGDVPDKSWGGFHFIERSLYTQNTLAGMAPVGAKLQSDIELLNKKVQTIKLQPAQIANGATELLDEVSKSKITGEEERYSHIDLVDFEGNVEGSKAAFESVKSILDKSDPELAKEVNARFSDVETALQPYRSGGGSGDGFVSYTALTAADKRKLSQVIDALAEPLSQVPAKVAA